MISRRSFLAAVASALVAARAKRIAAGAATDVCGLPAAPVYELPAGALIAAGFFALGDIITFGGDPCEYRVTAITRDHVHFSPEAWLWACWLDRGGPSR